MQLQIAPSLLAADFLHLSDEVAMLNKRADMIHLDVMDGTLVPNISFGFSVVEPLSKIAEIPMDVHLMIVHPEKYFKRFVEAGADLLSFHLEAARLAGMDAAAMLDEIRGLGVKAGLAINPDIPAEDVFPYLDHADFILVMSVFAGFGGQKFIPETFDKVKAIREEASRRGLHIDIEVDGGVGTGNASELGRCGATMLVAGSSVFRSADPAATIAELRGE